MLLESTAFTFNDKFYKQLVGSPMSASESPMFGELVLNLLESECLMSFKESVIFIRDMWMTLF